MNFKSVTDRIFKKPLPIKTQDNKHFNHKKFILITRGPVNNVKVQAEPNFRNFINIPQILSKKGHNCLTSPNQMERGVPVADAKKKKYQKLDSGTCWRELGTRCSSLISVQCHKWFSHAGSGTTRR